MFFGASVKVVIGIDIIVFIVIGYRSYVVWKIIPYIGNVVYK